MPYKSMDEVNPALKGIRPPITLAQANHIARMADAIERKGGAESPWAAAIAQFKQIYTVEEGRWMLKKKTRASEAATEAEVKAQKARSRRYGIAIREGGNVTKPSKWSSVPDSQWGDPVNYAYPVPDAAHAGNANSQFAANKGEYNSKSRAIVAARLKRLSRKFKVGEFAEDHRAEEEVSYAGRVLGAVKGSEGKQWDVVLVEAGPEANNRFYWDPEVLERDAHVFEGAKSYDIHLPPGTPLEELTTRSALRGTKEILGVVRDPRWDPSIGKLGGIRGVYHVVEAWLKDKLLALSEASKLDVLGLSVDTISSVVNREIEGRVLMAITGVKKVLSVDVVGDPAAGGRFERLIASKQGKEVVKMEIKKEDLQQLIREGVQEVLGDEPPEEKPVRVQEEETPEKKGSEEGEVNKVLAEAKRIAEQARVTACGSLLSSKIEASKLPQDFQKVIRSQFEGRVFEAKDLDASIKAQADAIAALSKTGEVQGLGRVVVGPDPLQKLEWALDRLFGNKLPEKASDVPRLSGIRELYLLLTGDYDMRGFFDSANVRISEANVNTGTVTSLIKNALNKVLLQAFGQIPPWWGPIVSEMDYANLQQVTLIKTGGIPELPTVSEGAAYTELQWGDIEETSEWVKKGGYIGVTLEAIDRDDVGGIRRIPAEMGRAAARTLSSAIAALFTVNSGAGPVMADNYNLFDATNHGNLLTTALSAAAWEAVVQAVFKQTAPVSANRIGMRPSRILVPIELEMTARRIFEQPWSQTVQVHAETLLEGAAKIIAVPEWTDPTDWAAGVDPAVCEGICLGYRFGRQPEMFTADDPRSGSMFTNDEMRIKVRWFWTLGVADHRPLHKSNVTG